LFILSSPGRSVVVFAFSGMTCCDLSKNAAEVAAADLRMP
jgi:hypothetical protein